MTANHRALDEADLRLIDQVQRTPGLYDSKSPDYRLANKKEDQWDQVANNIGMSQWEARKRWTCLRDRYVRELKQMMLHSEHNKFGKNDFFRRMDFLRPFVKKRNPRQSRHFQDKNPLKLIPNIKAVMIESIENIVEIHSDIQQHHQEPSSISSPVQIIDSDSECSMKIKFPYAENSLEGENYSDYMNDIQEPYADYDDKQLITIGEGNQMNCHTSTSTHLETEMISIQAPLGVDSVETISAGTHIGPGMIDHSTNQSYRQDLECQSSPQIHDSEEFFARTIASYLKQLSRRHSIKAKVEMMQILEKYIEMEEATRQ